MFTWFLCAALLLTAVALLAYHARRENANTRSNPLHTEEGNRLCAACSKKVLLGKSGSIAWSTMDQPTSQDMVHMEARLRRKRQWLLANGKSFLDQVARREYTVQSQSDRCVECRCRLGPSEGNSISDNRNDADRTKKVDASPHVIDVVTHADNTLNLLERECQRVRENL